MAEKQLECTVRAAAHQKAWFAKLRADVFENKMPYAIVQADMPLELFHAMDVPVVSNQWWAAMISAKRLAPYYLDKLNAMGYHDGLCRYCSLSLASTIAGDPAQAPWGGLPKPALLSARLTCDCIQRVFETWAAKFGAPFVPLDAPGASELPPYWWELSRHRWRELFESHRLDFMVVQFRSLISTLEAITGTGFELERLRTLMEGVNQQEEYFEEVREMICNAPKAPIRMHEQVSNVMAAQWLRGSEWAIAHARAFRDEVQQRVEAGIAACPSERLRLMWVGAGLWHDIDFYTAFEEQYGAVFVWSMYLAFGPDGYIRYGLDDPLRALASRTVSFNEQLHNPPWANEWIVYQAKKHRIDAALVLEPQGTKPSATGNRFIERALESNGVPVLPIAADMWMHVDGTAMPCVKPWPTFWNGYSASERRFQSETRSPRPQQNTSPP
ncbi:MAG: 2-hydroxyacyl-CoA dehydratase [Bryobacteraceae bacterium]